MVKCLITRPNYDKVTSYLFEWSKEIIDFCNSKNIQCLNLKEKQVNRSNVESYLRKQNPRLVLFNGHGSNTQITGFNKTEILIESGKNDNLLKGKMIYAVSCDSARTLGATAVEEGAECFIGYKNKFVIYTDKYLETTPLRDKIAESFIRPSNRVSLSLLKGNSSQEASNKSKEEFKKEIKKYLASVSISGSERIAMGLLWDIDSQSVIGNEEAKI